MSNRIYMLDNVTSTTDIRWQMNSFIVQTENDSLIVIDGGYCEEWKHLTDKLREISGSQKPKVAGWFLSHAHRDHIDCFLEIIEHHEDELEIENVYYNFPSAQFLERNEPSKHYGNAPRNGEFYRLLPRFADRATVVTESDRYEVGGAVFDILYSGNPEFTHNANNNSSIVFRMILGGKSFIFLGDIGVEAGDQILRKYGDTLKSDYCQMAHHGQNGADRNLYEAIRPQACFWCTPLWLWDNDWGEGFNTGPYQTVEVRQWMESLGVREHYVMKDGDLVIEW